MSTATRRTLVAIPAYNEAATIRDVVARVRENLPECDLLIVNDGSRDATSAMVAGTGATVIEHICNLGYGRTIETALFYAQRRGYDRLVTLDADGQHDPAQVRGLLAAFDTGDWDVLVGSRYMLTHRYTGAPLGRRIGMQLFSAIVGIVAGRRIYDTTSGLKVIGRQTYAALTNWPFIDFHAEALVYLMRLGYRVGEFPMTMDERRHGTSMHSPMNHIKYPLKTTLLIVLGIVESTVTKRRAS